MKTAILVIGLMFGALAPTAYADNETPTEGDFCREFALNTCIRINECNEGRNKDMAGCKRVLMEGCCLDRGTCAEPIPPRGVNWARCLLDVLRMACDGRSDIPKACTDAKYTS